jgi:DNA-binding Lrp family transcriptional regulator
MKSTSAPLFYKNDNGKIIPLDDINIDIIKRMLNDAAVSDSTLSAKLDISDSKIKRRRRLIEEHFLTRNYLLDISQLGWRIGDIQIDVRKGKSEQLANQIFLMFPNILEITLRVNSTATVSARIFYKDNTELASVIDKIKHLSFVSDVAFSEIIKIVRARSIGTMKDIFADRVRSKPKRHYNRK